MWKNWRTVSAPQPNIMSYDEYYNDERYLETIHEVESIRERPQSIAHPSDLPFRGVSSPQQENKVRASSSVYENDTRRNSRITSSLYSQPSPTLPPDNVKNTILTKYDSVADEVSPVSTPRSPFHRMGSDTPVSPIESTHTIPPRSIARRPAPEQKTKSQIPIPVTDNGTTPPGQRTKKQGTKWDAYSGEQTSLETGKRGSVDVGVQSSADMQFPQLKERTRQILAGLRERDATARRHLWGKQPPPVDDSMDAPIEQRPAWKGASGREATVDPVRNTPAARTGPLHLPHRNANGSGHIAELADTSVPDLSTTLQPVRELSPPTQAVSTPRTEQSIRIVASQEDMKPVPPLKMRLLKSKSPIEPGSQDSLQSPFQSPSPRGQQGIPPNETNQDPHHFPSTPETHSTTSPSTPVQKSSNTAVDSQKRFLDSSRKQDEVSRFSWTTYATTTVTGSPSSTTQSRDGSPAPPLPPAHASGGLIGIRSRTMPTSASRPGLPYSSSEARLSNASIVVRKPVGNNDRRRSTSMMLSKSKDLPPPPPQDELNTGDKISNLEARQRHLMTRKRNNSKVRSELTETLIRNAVTYDIFKHKEVKDRIKELEREMDEITQEEHDVGVRLHRAQKKRDKADEYGRGTALWINRVTQ